MEGQVSANGPLPEALDFEGRFISSCPITDNPSWWHHEQSSLEQQLPDFIPIHNDAGASHKNLVNQAGCNADISNVDQSSSRSIKYRSGYRQQMEFGNTSTEVGSGSNILPYQPAVGVGSYQGNGNGSGTDVSNSSFNQLAVMESSMNDFITKDLLTNVVPSGHESTGHTATANSSARTSMNFLRTGIIFREENNRSTSAVITAHPSDKRKSPDRCLDESSAMASKRSVQVAGSSGSHAAPSSHIAYDGYSMSTSSATIYGLGSLGTLSSGTVPPPRGSFIDIPPQPGRTTSDQNVRQGSHIRTNTHVQGSVPANLALSGTIISSNSVVQRPRLVIPPPQAVGEGSNVRNFPMTVQCPVTSQQDVHFTGHHIGSRSIARNSSGPNFTMGISTTEMDEIGLRNSTHSLQLPVIAPPAGPSNLAHITMNFGTSGGDASISRNTNLGTPSDPDPNLPGPTPNFNSNSYRRRRMERIRQALLDVSSFSEESTISHPEVHLGITPETRQMLISRARHLITMYRGGRDISLLEDGVNARQSLVSALASIHDQHRDMRLDVDNMSYEELLELGERIGDVKTGLSEETIMDSLKCNKYTFTAKANQPNAERCSICREEYAEGDDMGTLDCGHEYHTNCIKQWLVLKNSCPICKAAAAASSSK